MEIIYFTHLRWSVNSFALDTYFKYLTCIKLCENINKNMVSKRIVQISLKFRFLSFFIQYEMQLSSIVLHSD